MWVGVVMMALGADTVAQVTKNDELIIRDMVTDAIRRLNQGDISVVREYWDEQADYVGVDGQLIRGRAAIEGFFSRMLTPITNRPTQTATIDQVRFVRPDVAIVDGSWTITGARGASGHEVPPLHGHGVEVVRRTQKGWRFVATRESVLWKDR